MKLPTGNPHIDPLTAQAKGLEAQINGAVELDVPNNAVEPANLTPAPAPQPPLPVPTPPPMFAVSAPKATAYHTACPGSTTATPAAQPSQQTNHSAAYEQVAALINPDARAQAAKKQGVQAILTLQLAQERSTVLELGRRLANCEAKICMLKHQNADVWSKAQKAAFEHRIHMMQCSGGLQDHHHHHSWRLRRHSPSLDTVTRQRRSQPAGGRSCHSLWLGLEWEPTCYEDNNNKGKRCVENEEVDE